MDEVEEFEFELNEVYSIDIVISSAIPLAALHDWNVWIFADLDVRAIVWLHFL